MLDPSQFESLNLSDRTSKINSTIESPVPFLEFEYNTVKKHIEPRNDMNIIACYGCFKDGSMCVTMGSSECERCETTYCLACSSNYCRRIDSKRSFCIACRPSLKMSSEYQINVLPTFKGFCGTCEKHNEGLSQCVFCGSYECNNCFVLNSCSQCAEMMQQCSECLQYQVYSEFLFLIDYNQRDTVCKNCRKL